MFTEHSNQYHEDKLEVIKIKHVGFDLTEIYRCSQCYKDLIKWCSFNINTASAGCRSIDVNMNITVGMYASATNVYKMNEFCSKVGIIFPSLNGM